MISKSKPAAQKLADLLNRQQSQHAYAVYRCSVGWIVR